MGLVDKLGFIEDAVDRAISMAGLDPGNVRVVKYTRNTSLFDALDPVPSATANRGVESNLGTLADLAIAAQLITYGPGCRRRWRIGTNERSRFVA